MEIAEVSPKEYDEAFASYPHIYNSVGFSELNSHKAERLRYLIFRNEKVRFGLITGEREGVMLSPFSAPFGGFTANKQQTVSTIEDAVISLQDYCRAHETIARISLQPLIYNPTELSKTANVMARVGHTVCTDLNYHFDLSDFDNYEDNLNRNGRNKLHQAMKEDMMFIAVSKDDSNGLAEAYDVIRRNRAEHGYPLRMSYEDVVETIKVVDADFFLLSYNDKNIAAAQIFHVTDKICQVIYWGDLGEFSHLRTMNCLAYHIFAHYRSKGINILDIGPASEEGIPNYGLCDFKESVGCRASLKFTFEL